ncbi:hypothetical protein ACFQDI_21495 [Prosthecobacter fluviatilis]|uniref:Uncharacterized protein n=2 Tax=Prosthecobacter fluviatilis TaxID=445931 RepID=A0ABW0KYG2_9BACT
MTEPARRSLLYRCRLLLNVIIFLAGCVLCLISLTLPTRGSGPGAPLEGVAEGILLLSGLGLLLIGGLLLLFRMRPPANELLGDQLTSDHILLVTQHTGVVFPPAAKLVGLCLQDASSLSANVASKFELPDSCRDAFMQNSIFSAGLERSPHYELGSATTWWRRGRLESRIDRVQYLPSGTYVECSVGLEDNCTVVYVSWG